MPDAVIVSACRTPIGRFQGGLKSFSAPQLGAIAIKEAISRAGIAADDVEEVIMGNVIQAGLGQNPARQAMLGAGVPETVGAFTVNKVCGSGLKSVMLAAQAIRAGSCDVAIAVGTEKMFTHDKAKMFAAFDSAWDVTTVDSNQEYLLKMGEGITPPEGSQSGKPYSMFMDVYAAFCRQHIKTFGTTQEQIAAVCAKTTPILYTIPWPSTRFPTPWKRYWPLPRLPTP